MSGLKDTKLSRVDTEQSQEKKFSSNNLRLMSKVKLLRDKRIAIGTRITAVSNQGLLKTASLKSLHLHP